MNVVGKRNMTLPKKQILWTIVAMTIFYIGGRLAYEYFYRWTLDIIRYFSDDKLGFFGKYPFWFIGDPIFGLIFCSIPLTIFLSYQILRNKMISAFRWTLAFYSILFIGCFLALCYFESFTLITSNDFYKTGQELKYNIRDVSLNSIFLWTIITATILTSLINLVKRFWGTKNASLQLHL